jgi:hypothetical protein
MRRGRKSALPESLELLLWFITAVPNTKLGPVRNPVLEHRVAPCFPWFLSFGNRTQNSRVAGARPNHQPIGGSDPNHQGIWTGAHPGRDWDP